MQNSKFVSFYITLTLLFLSGLIRAQGRTTYSINESWQFHRGDINKNTQLNDEGEWQIIDVPHTWNDQDILDETPGYYRGICWYKKETFIDESFKGKNIFLKFEGVNQETELYVNGKSAGEPHIGGYTSFAYDITSFVKVGEKALFEVKVDNSHNKDIIPLSADFTFYGGIYRDIYLIGTNKSHFSITDSGNSGVYVDMPQVSKSEAELRIKSNIATIEGKGYLLRHRLMDSDGEHVQIESSKLKEHHFQKEIEVTMEIKSPQLWSPQSPYLYTLYSEIVDRQGVVVDRVTNPVGLRWYKFDAEKGFFINGEYLKLVGTNRHQDYLNKGNALSDELHRNDMLMLKDMGINFLRISHYPQDPSVLEMCDRLGIIVSEEIPFVNEMTLSDDFEKNALRNMREMIRRDYNHPCIVAWGTSNETTIRQPNIKGEALKNYYKNLSDILSDLKNVVKEEDPSRLSLVVHCCGFDVNEERQLHQADIVGYNLYYGWYYGAIEDIAQGAEDFHKLRPDLPFVVSEYGAGADPRIHTFEPKRFDHSIEYQALFHRKQFKVILNTPWIVGSNVWNFADFYVEGRREATTHVNNKGLVTLDRKPKDSFYYYKTVLTDKPYVVIPSKLWTNKGGIADSYHNTCTQKLDVYSNQPLVELFHNGVSLGKKKVVDYVATYDVPFVNGENRMEAAAGLKDNSEIKDFLDIQFTLVPEKLKSGKLPVYGIAINVGSHFYFVDDSNGNELWFPDRKYMEGSYGYVGGKTFYRNYNDVVGSDADILGSELDPLYQTVRYDLDAYKFDVEDGQYEVSLLFAEIFEDAHLREYLKREESETAERDWKRVFDIFVNGQKVMGSLNLKQTYGGNRAVCKKIIVYAEDGKGLQIDFGKIKSVPILSGIKIRRVY